MYSARYPNKGRSMDSLKRKFKELYIKMIPTGDPHCPPAVRGAKRLRNAIIELMDGSDLNSPARGARKEDDASGTGDAVGMGGEGEGGESSGSSDDDDDNRNEDQGFEDATTEPTAGLDAPRTGDKRLGYQEGQQQLLPVQMMTKLTTKMMGPVSSSLLRQTIPPGAPSHCALRGAQSFSLLFYNRHPSSFGSTKNTILMNLVVV